MLLNEKGEDCIREFDEEPSWEIYSEDLVVGRIGLNLWKLGCKNWRQIELDQRQVLGFIAVSAASGMQLIFMYKTKGHGTVAVTCKTARS
jgi:hypothetical protein